MAILTAILINMYATYNHRGEGEIISRMTSRNPQMNNSFSFLSQNVGKNEWINMQVNTSIPLDSTNAHPEPKHHKIMNNITDVSSIDSEESSLKLCGKEVELRLSQPQLAGDDLEWCERALSPHGGQVVVGKSWGKLSSRKEKDKFEALNCNSVSKGLNPSCSDAWGDSHVYRWRKNTVVNVTCQNRSGVRCRRNDLNDQYCVFDNAMIDFSRYRKVSSGREIGKRIFEKDFLTIDCEGQQEGEIPSFEFNHLYSPKRPRDWKCDVFIPGTTVLYSHDNIRNLCHTWNDWLNVWLLLWLEDIAQASQRNINFLTVDSMKQYNDFDDTVNDFFVPYFPVFKKILRGADFRYSESDKRSRRVCFESLVTQSLPSRGFVWENWQQDIPCSFVGPSSLFQRWNLQLRRSFNLINAVVLQQFKERPLQVLLIVRSEKKNDWGSYRTSRLMENTEDVIASLRQLSSKSGGNIPKFELRVQDMSKVGNLEKQLRLIAETSVIVGMHGAGIVHSMHMSVGAENCCGVLEIFPRGEFFPVRGYANMVRRMGIHYSRMDLSDANSRPNGAYVPPSELVNILGDVLKAVHKSSSCVLESVVKNPFLH